MNLEGCCGSNPSSVEDEAWGSRRFYHHGAVRRHAVAKPVLNGKNGMSRTLLACKQAGRRSVRKHEHKP